MNEHWQRVQILLDAALDLPPDTATAFLDEHCADDPALRREVEALLAACRRADGFLEAPPAALMAAMFVDAEAGDGRRIGPYRIVGEAGRGGMGVVYIAERADGQFDHRVALKVLSREVTTAQVVACFLEERQILATLRHPAIARLLDGGVTPGGVPYFVMEFVDGTPIDVHCNTHGLDIEGRLALFVEICNAVQYAHQNLVVHRDIKPSNILVDDEGAIKLLDFGIAKILPRDGEPNDDGSVTIGRWLTPRYASPEQIRGDPITTVSDLYSLGILLYELLTGQRPYAVSGETPGAIERAICEQEPELPSVAALVGAGVGGLTPAKLSRRLRGDLDTIVSMALRKEPGRRYASAAALADDVQRHLARLPVHARPSAVAYRASRFIRRHRAGVAASIALLLSLAAGFASTLRQGRIAARERDNAQLQAATASRVSALLVDMFRIADPDANRGATITAREVLAQGARRVERDLADQPLLRARMLAEIASVYQNLGLYDDAEPLVEEAVAVWRGGDDASELARAIDRLGEMDLARARFPAAESRFREALELQRGLHADAHPDVAVAITHLADALSALRRHEDADSLYREALAMHEQVVSDPLTVATTFYSRAANLHDNGNFDDAEPLFRRAVAIYRTIPGDRPDPRAATALLNLSAVLTFREDYEQAEPLAREALAMRRAIYGPAHPAIVEALAALGSLLYNTSRVNQAEPVLREAIEMEAAMPGDDPNTPHTRMILAATLSGLGSREHLAEARQLFRDVIDGATGLSPLAVYARIHMAESEIIDGRLDAARETYSRALGESRRLFGESHPYVALSMRGLADVDLAYGEYDAAERALRSALAMLDSIVRPDHRYALTVKRTLAETLAARGRFSAADSLFRDVLDVQRERMTPTHLDAARTLHGYGSLRLAMKDASAAETLLREALTTRRDRLGPDHWQVAESESALGATLDALGRREEAASMLTHAWATLRSRFGAADRRTRHAFERLNGNTR